MRRKVIPVWILMAVFLASAIVAGVAFKVTIPDCGLSDWKRTAEIPAGMVSLNYVWGANDGDEDAFVNGELQTEERWDGIDSSSVIAAVKSTGAFELSEGSMGQEIVVQEVFRGQELVEEGQTCFVYQSNCFEVLDEVEFVSAMNLMNPAEEYLIFMEKSPLSPYLEEPVFLLSSEILGYIKIGGEETQTLERNYKNYDFTELTGYEFFSVSDQITKDLNHIRAEILTEYYEQ